jgi:hypothetical protein
VPDELAERVLRVYEQSSAAVTPRTRSQVRRFFDGFDLVEPGITREYGWRPDPFTEVAGKASLGWVGVGRKP